ncbi:MAG: hypothetical protein WD733_03495 [Bryobacterales bacterium]
MALFRILCLAAVAAVLGPVPLAAQLSTEGNQLWRQGADGILDVSDENDRFGQTLAAGDFNGDGWDDLAIGAFGENDFRGVVNVIYGGPGGLTSAGNQLWEQGVGGIDGNAESGDRFGVTVAAGDFNGDGYADLVVGASGEDDDRGIVHAIYGSASGLTSQGNQAWRQGDNGIGDSAEDGDAFGFSLAVGEFNGDGFDDVAASGPGEDGTEGLVVVIFGSAGGLISNGNQRWREGEDGLRGDGEGGDFFGYALAAGDFNGDGFDDLGVGTPGENSARGTVNIIYGSGGGLTSVGNVRRQMGEDGVAGTATAGGTFGEVMAAGDFNSDGFADLAVSPLGAAEGRGGVIVIPGSSSGLTGAGSSRWHQGFFRDDVEAGDRFGSALATGDFNADGFMDLAIGVRGEDGNRGVVHVAYGSDTGLIPPTGQEFVPVFSQGADGLLDTAEQNDDFGFELAAGNFGGGLSSDLAVGAPGEDNSRGVVHVLFGLGVPIVSAVVGGGLSSPPVAAVSHNSIVSVFGENFVAASAAALQPSAKQQDTGATILNGVCVEINGGVRAPLFAVTPQQINLQVWAPQERDAIWLEVIVNCGQPNERRSERFDVPVAPATPEFFFFAYNPDGVNPIAAVHEPGGALAGAPGLIPGAVFEPARPNDVVTVYMTGMGETTPQWGLGQFPTGAASANLPVSIQIGGADVEVIYAGVTPGFFGLYQASFSIPADAQAGELPARITVGSATTPAGGFLTVAR